MNQPQSAPSPTILRWSIDTTRVVWAMAALWTGLLLLWIYRYSITDGGMACWDGFDRCSKAATLWVTLQAGDWGLFWEYTHHQTVWPFLHAWITAALFYVFGPDLHVARLVAWASYGLIAWMMLGWFQDSGKQNLPIAALGGLIAWALFTTTANPIEHASSVMSEIPGLALVMLTLIALPKSSENHPTRLVFSAFCLGLIFYYKYNYAALTFIGIACARFAAAGFNPKAAFTRDNAILFGVPLGMFVLWLLPNFMHKWAGLTYFAVNNPEARTPLSLDFFLVYPRLIPETYFAHPWLAAITLALVVQAIPFTPRLRLGNPVVTCFLIHTLAAVIHPMKDIRFMFIPMGLFYILVGMACVGTMERFAFARSTTRWAPAAVCTLLAVAAAMVTHLDLHHRAHVTHDRNYLAPVHTLINQLAPEDRPALLLAHDHVTPPVMDYYLTRETTLLRNPMNGEPFRWSHLFMFQKGEAVRALPEDQRFAQLRHELYLAQANTIVTLQSTQPWQVNNFENLYAGVHEYANLPPYMGEFELQYEKYFPALEALLRIYRLRS